MQLVKVICIYCVASLLACKGGGLHLGKWGGRVTLGALNQQLQEAAVHSRALLGKNETDTYVHSKASEGQGQGNNTSASNVPNKHYADLGPGFLTSTTEAAIKEQSTESCKCIKAEERCIQLGFNCLEKKCIKSELQCEEIDTVCMQYAKECKETKCTEWETKCEEELSTCVEVHYDEELGTTCLRQETQCLKWAFTCSNSVCVAQNYECVKRAPPICVAFKVKCAEEHCSTQEISCAVPEKNCLEFEKGCEP